MTAIPPRTRMPVPEALARPNVVAPQPYSLPTPTRFRLSNGAKGLAYDLPGQYVLSVRMAIPMPLRVEPREVEGVATIMARTLDEGTARHTALEFARLLERRQFALLFRGGAAYVRGVRAAAGTARSRDRVRRR